MCLQVCSLLVEWYAVVVFFIEKASAYKAIYYTSVSVTYNPETDVFTTAMKTRIPLLSPLSFSQSKDYSCIHLMCFSHNVNFSWKSLLVHELGGVAGKA